MISSRTTSAPWRPYQRRSKAYPGRRNLLRYNRVEGPAIASLGGRTRSMPAAFLGISAPKRELRAGSTPPGTGRLPFDPRGRYLGFGNSMYAFLFGRDEGEYFRATGTDFTWRPPVGARESFEFRAYGAQASVATSFALFRVWKLAIPPKHRCRRRLRLSPWLGGDPFGTQLGLDLYAHGARWRTTGESAGTNYRECRPEGGHTPGLSHLAPGLGAGWGNDLGRRTPPTQLVPGRGPHAPWISSLGIGSSFARGRVDLARRHRHHDHFRRRRLGRLPNGLRRGRSALWVGVGGSVFETCPTGSRVPTSSSDLYLDALL